MVQECLKSVNSNQRYCKNKQNP